MSKFGLEKERENQSAINNLSTCVVNTQIHNPCIVKWFVCKINDTHNIQYNNVTVGTKTLAGIIEYTTIPTNANTL